MFKEVPAWGIYVRHAKEVSFANIKLKVEKKDYRLPLVLDDVQGVQLKKISFEQTGQKKLLYDSKSTGITVVN